MCTGFSWCIDPRLSRPKYTHLQEQSVGLNLRMFIPQLDLLPVVNQHCGSGEELFKIQRETIVRVPVKWLKAGRDGTVFVSG